MLHSSNPHGFYCRIVLKCDQDLWFQYIVSLEPAPVWNHVFCCSRVYNYFCFCLVWWFRCNIDVNPFYKSTRYKGTCECSSSSFFIFPCVLLLSPPLSIP